MSRDSADQSPSRAPAVLAALVAGLVGGFAGALLVSRGGGERGDTGGPASTASRDPHTLDALAALTRELAALRADLARRDDLVATPTQLAPAATAAGDDPDGAVARLAALLLERTAARPAAPGGSVSERTPLVDPFDVPGTRLDSQKEALAQAFAGLEVDETETYRRRFLLLTERQVLERFGRPDRISAHDGSVTWEYAITEDQLVGFVMAEGLVVGSW